MDAKQKFNDFYKLSKDEFADKWGLIEYHLLVTGAMYIKERLKSGKRPAVYVTRELICSSYKLASYFIDLTAKRLMSMQIN